MSKNSSARFVLTLTFALGALAPAVASAEAPPVKPAARPSTLERANADVLRQLRPSGLKQHGASIGRIAVRGYHDVLATIHAPSAKPAPRR